MPRVFIPFKATNRKRLFNPFEITSVSYTSATRYSFMGTGMRWPNAGQATTAVYMITEWWFGTPAYTTTDHRVFAPQFFSPTTGETSLAAGASITIQGWSIETSPGVWVACDGAADAGLVTIDNTTAGSLLPRVQATLAPNTMYRARIAFFVSSAGITIPRQNNDALNAAGGSTRTQGQASSFFSRLTTSGAALTNANGVAYVPAYMIAKGGDGRPAFLALGDSIGYGVNSSQVGAAWSNRNAFGYIERGMDDNTTTKRLALFNGCVPGQRPCASGGWDYPSNWPLKIAALQAAYNVQNAWPFDFIISQHITNAVPYTGYDGGVLRVGMARYYTLLKTLFNKPITQIEGLPADSSTDGFQTVTNQTGSSGKVYPSSDPGTMWYFNADVGTNGIPDASLYYRSNNFIEDSIGAWRYVSADTGANRGKWAVRPFSTTLAAAADQNATTASFTAAPTVGMTIYIAQTAGGFSTTGRNVKAVTGTGPYTVTFDATPFSGSGGSASGAIVQEAGSEGLHPSPIVHRDVLVPAITDWKTRRGWV